jgi:hypothetical protein
LRPPRPKNRSRPEKRPKKRNRSQKEKEARLEYELWPWEQNSKKCDKYIVLTFRRK